jgi:chondroitin-sulfate-ABC endolyase/exolyase
MREPLLESGRLERVRNTLKYNYHYSQIFADGPAVCSMDRHYNDVRYLFKIAVMHDTPEEIVKHLRIFKRRYDRMIIDTIKPDGSLYHHGAHYYAYAGGAMASTSDTFLRTMGTPFQPSREAFNVVKMAVMNMRYYANVTDLPVVMHGRHPGRQHLNGSAFSKMAEAGRGYNDGKLDPELAAAYLRLNPDDAGKAVYTNEQIVAESAPQGNLAMNYAGLMGHRRGEWLAMVRGYGKYYWACESYNNANRHGLFFGNGTLSILAAGDPVNIIDSGCDIEKGWDWRMFDGATTIYMPYKQMANGNGTMSERSGVSFVGGLSHRGENGVFVMPIRSALQYGKAMNEDQERPKGEMFEADKSYFFFDNRIVCLGSGIRAKDVHHSIRTTLFQNSLKSTDIPIYIDGQAATNFPYKTVLKSEKDHTLMDIQNSGYYIPAGQKIHVERRHQKSRNGHDNKDTEGDAAVAWLEHGNGPTNAVYEYVLLVNTTVDKLAEFSAAMQSDPPPDTGFAEKHTSAYCI